ncbi:MAG: UDP-N-acetylmuramyl-tripeptide synthetase [Bacillota bacterium]|nr:UDP-N-acetylmuramyl-tripeptide synthetase [Bacillota bacterium]
MPAVGGEERGRALAELAAGLGGRLEGCAGSVRVEGIGVDSRRIRPGDLFVALPGSRVHGAAYLEEARSRGARAAVLPPEAPAPEGFPVLRHPDAAGILPELAARLYGRPGERLRLAGVTGTNGKTTTALLLAHLLRAAGRRVAVWTTTVAWAPSGPFRPLWTTPPAHELQRWLRQAADAGCEEAVLEVSSHGVVQGRIAGLRFAAGVATNLSPDHLDFHGSLEAYAAAKRAFIAALEPPAVAVLNAEDPVVRSFARAARAHVVDFGFGAGAGVGAEEVRTGTSGSDFRMRVGDPELARRAGLAAGERIPVRLRLVGRHNVANVLAASAAALWLGLRPDRLPEALASFAPPPRRLESVRVGPFTVVNDVAMNEASCETVLRAVGAMSPPQLVVVHAVRGRRGPEVNAGMGRVLARWNRRLRFAPLVVSLSLDRLGRYPVDHRPREEEVEALRRAAEEGELPLSVHASLEEAIAEAVDRLQPGGLLLLLGTFGMDDGPWLAVERLAARLGVPPPPPPRYPLPEG